MSDKNEAVAAAMIMADGPAPFSSQKQRAHSILMRESKEHESPLETAARILAAEVRRLEQLLSGK